MVVINDKKKDDCFLNVLWWNRIVYCDKRNRKKNEWIKNGTGQWLSLRKNEWKKKDEDSGKWINY